MTVGSLHVTDELAVLAAARAVTTVAVDPDRPHRARPPHRNG
jgi:hypothetical protein